MKSKSSTTPAIIKQVFRPQTVEEEDEENSEDDPTEVSMFWEECKKTMFQIVLI